MVQTVRSHAAVSDLGSILFAYDARHERVNNSKIKFP